MFIINSNSTDNFQYSGLDPCFGHTEVGAGCNGGSGELDVVEGQVI
jgi:hypothetical protein